MCGDMLFIADRGGISETQVLYLKETLNEENSIDVTYHILQHNVTHSSSYGIHNDANNDGGT